MTDLEKTVQDYQEEIELFENGKLKLDNDQLLEIADKLVGFNEHTLDLSFPFRRKCDNNIYSGHVGCPEANCKDENSCEHVLAIGLADYIYRNLIHDLDPDRKTLCCYIEDGLLPDFSLDI